MTLSSALTAFAVLLSPVGNGWTGSSRHQASSNARRRQLRKDYQRLLSLGDHALADIGISRAEVEAALAECGRR